eukprot:755866-Hanusia_phi.AAC.2
MVGSERWEDAEEGGCDLVLVLLLLLTGSQLLSSESTRLLRQHPTDPTPWFDQVNVFFKGGEKGKAADLLHDASLVFPAQPDLAFNHAFVRYELGEYATSVKVLEKLAGLGKWSRERKGKQDRKGNKDREKKKNSGDREEEEEENQGDPSEKEEDGREHVEKKREYNRSTAGSDSLRHAEPKWVDLLIKCYVKVGRVGDAVRLTDKQLAAMAGDEKDPLVRARVALTVFPWRYGSATWKDLGQHRKELVRAVELTLGMSQEEVEKAGIKMTPHNSLIFLDNELGSRVIERHILQSYLPAPVNGSYARLRTCPTCKYQPQLRIGYLLWEVRESDVLYSLLAGILQEHSRQSDPPQVKVYTLTRRPPPESLRFRGRSVSFISFSGVGGKQAAEVIRKEKTEVLLDLTTYGDLTGAHILQHLPAPLQAGKP